MPIETSETRKAIAVETGKHYARNGRNIAGYFARLGDLEERAGDIPTAVEKLQARLENLPSIRGDFARHFSIAGFTLILVPEDRGTREFLVCPDGHVSVMTTGETHLPTVECHARLHIAQRLYPDREKAQPVVAGWAYAEREFAGWSEFQDRYAAARKVGYSDVECHDFAGRNPGRPHQWFLDVAARITSSQETLAAIAEMRQA
jgi:hypothetical protein